MQMLLENMTEHMRSRMDMFDQADMLAFLSNTCKYVRTPGLASKFVIWANESASKTNDWNLGHQGVIFQAAENAIDCLVLSATTDNLDNKELQQFIEVGTCIR